MPKNFKIRNDDKRVGRILHPILQDKKWLSYNYEILKKTTLEIAREVGCKSPTVFHALVLKCIPRRSRKEARIGIKFTQEHKNNITIHMRNLAKLHTGENHWNWQGGKTVKWMREIAKIKQNPKYKSWVIAVKSIGYCEACGSIKQLEAHHIFPKSKFPHLIHDINNGKCLCRRCHINLHSEKINGMNSGKPKRKVVGNPEPSRVESRKVQRLPEEDTSSLITGISVPLVRDDIVQAV